MGRDIEDGEHDLYEWREIKKYVCVRCVPDKFLKRLICKNVQQQRCDYCNTERLRNIAAPVSILMEPIVFAFKRHFSDPVHGGCFNDREASDFIRPLSTGEALQELLPEWGDDDNSSDLLLNHIAKAFQNELWIKAPDGMYMGEHEHEAMTWSWEAFARMIKHEQRFFFHVQNQDRSTQSYIPPSEMLPTLGGLVNRLGLVTQVDSGTQLFRARIRDADANWPLDAEQLGAPPLQKASAGRMNPAGISYLYLALDKATALAETVSRPPNTVVVGCWTIENSKIVVDLTHLPEEPSVFDEAGQRNREELLFLNEFVVDIQKSIQKNNNEHIEYLPSQVVSEYFSQIFRSENNVRIDGLMYRSATRPLGINLVFFPENNRQTRFSNFKFNGCEQLVLTDLGSIG